MHRLYILRHAKSSWALPGVSDFDRGLNDRGKKDLAKIARAMQQYQYLPKAIISSPAKRTKATIKGIYKALRADLLNITYIDNLYSGSLSTYFEAIASHTPDQGVENDALMIVGHNPTCDALASFLVSSGEKKPMHTLATKYPTGALAVIDLDIENWTDIKENCGYLVDFLLPRKLPS